MNKKTAFRGARIFTGDRWESGLVLVVENGRIATLVEETDAPEGLEIRDLPRGSSIVPGFIDLQVNGGGGVMLNDAQTVEGIATICAAHARFGTTALLPTLITDRVEITRATIAAGIEAARLGVPGFLGLHLEGPHLSVARKGAHDPSLIRPMEEEDLETLLQTVGRMPVLMTTVAPENVTPEQVDRLSSAGILVSLGHTDCDADTVLDYAAAGARAVTHLFNAMSQLGNREPGVVGAALEEGMLHAGLIADGFHVNPITMRIALSAKNGPGRIFLVTDAMSPIGTDLDGFTLNGRQIYRKDGRLTLADGTLAGADIDMLSSVRFVHETLGLPLGEALRMASLYPAEAAGMAATKGRLQPGMDADFVILDGDLGLVATHIGGVPVYTA
ncbi:N-acetylglucosamine-6-phosphate deacetylase [Gellertiella hungarica]|uniref:N-acetylglucosamine-6-phosphate deacetylase n=1 Tax=Gellertiella hungarica TaxID=1572859 RepID=A0A7W6J182_9HYPH|nr:N-acetylglucosamine-6-phosphate deacetylase [Gellertiella hungarica]MBB4062911.1 N-acetylglucosamine-6-phosphate deacetylase [Gellertiella hungarica]